MRISIDNFYKNTKLEEANATLQADKDNLLAQVKALETKVSDMDKTVAAFPGAKQAWEAETAAMKADHAKAVDAVKAEYEAKVSALTKELEATKVSVSNKVVTELASVGIPQGTVKEEISQPMTAKEVYNKFVTIPAGPARTAYFKANEKLIVQGSREQ